MHCNCRTTSRREGVCRDCYEQEIRRETREMFPSEDSKSQTIEAKGVIYSGDTNVTSSQENRRE